MSEISTTASKEFSLEKAMEKMKNEWSEMMFEFTPYRDSVCFYVHQIISYTLYCFIFSRTPCIAFYTIFIHVAFLTFDFQGLFILAAVDEIQLMFDDHIIKAQTMSGSPFIKPFEKEINEWCDRLVMMQDILDNWLKV